MMTPTLAQPFLSLHSLHSLHSHSAQDVPVGLDDPARCCDAAKLESASSLLSKLKVSLPSLASPASCFLLPASCFLVEMNARSAGHFVLLWPLAQEPPPLRGAICAVPVAADGLCQHAPLPWTRPPRGAGEAAGALPARMVCDGGGASCMCREPLHESDKGFVI